MAWSGLPSRSWLRASRSHGSVCRRLSASRLAPRRAARPRKAPPASISGSWHGSPTSTTLAPACSAWARSRASLRVPTMAASSTTTTLRASRPGRPGRLRSARNRSIVEDGMPASSWRCLAARAASEHPMTRWPDSVHASSGGGEGEGLAGPGQAFDHLDTVAGCADGPDHGGLLVRERVSAGDRSGEGNRCRPDLPRPVAAGGRRRRDLPRPRASRGWSSGSRRSSPSTELPSARRIMAPAGSRPTAKTCSDPRNPSTRASTSSTFPPNGSELQTALMTSR